MSCALNSPASSPESSSADFSLPASPTFMYRMTSRNSIYGMEIVHEEQRQLINRLGSHVIYSRFFCEVSYMSVWLTLLTCDLTWSYKWNFPYHTHSYKVWSLVDTSWSVHSFKHIFGGGWVDGFESWHQHIECFVVTRLDKQILSVNSHFSPQ